MDVPLSNSLTVLAERVKLTMDESEVAEKTAIEKALAAGSLLSEAKAECSHGDWLPQRYMRLAWSGLKSDTVSHLGGITAALRWAHNLDFPSSDEILLASVDGFSESNTTAIVYPFGDHFHVAGIDLSEASPHSLFTLKPIPRGEFVWLTLYRVLDFRYQEMTFKVVPFDINLIRLCRVEDDRAFAKAVAQ